MGPAGPAFGPPACDMSIDPATTSSLPPLGTGKLPAPGGFWRMMGPGLVMMALAQGSGELIWWPFLVAKYGAAFLFLLIPACFLQFPLTFEIGRYTILTGEGIFRGFFRLSRVFGIFIWILFTLSFIWLGAFASAGGSAMAKFTDAPGGLSLRAHTLIWGQGTILFFTIGLVFSKRVYALVEWVMKVVAIVSTLGMLIACMHPKVREVIGEFAQALFIPDRNAMEIFDPRDADRLMTAVAFAGLGGFWTLFYSYWMREKGAGMASLGAIGGAGHLPQTGPEAAGRLASWYRYLRVESLIGIVGNLFTTLMTCLLAYAILMPAGLIPKGDEIASVQGEFFAQSWGNAGRLLFLFIAGTFLADTWLATADCIARIQLDVISIFRPSVLRNPVKAYRVTILIIAALTSAMMYIDRPGPLIEMMAILGFFGTVIYSAAILLLNHGLIGRRLPPEMRPGKTSAVTMIFICLCYAGLAAGYLYIKIKFAPDSP